MDGLALVGGRAPIERVAPKPAAAAPWLAGWEGKVSSPRDGEDRRRASGELVRCCRSAMMREGDVQ